MSGYKDLNMPHIALQNGKVAGYIRSRRAMVPDIDPDKEIDIHEYHAPCPLCSTPALVMSINGWSFVSHDVTCMQCGVRFRPIHRK